LRRYKKVSAAVACAAAVVVVAGCGSSSSNSSGGSGDPVAFAAAASTSAPGYKMTLNMKISSPQLASPITATGNGAFNVPQKAGAFTLAMNLGNSPQVTQALGSSTLNLEEIIKAPIIYVKLPTALSSKIPGGKPWLKVDLSQLGSASGVPGLGALATSPGSSDPSQFLQYLRAVGGSITKVGTESVNGVQTTHYKGTISLDKVPNALPAASRQAAAAGIKQLETQTGLKELPADVWIDDKHLVRQMQLNFDTSAQGQKISTQMTMNITQYGPQPVPVSPPDSQTLDAGALLGAASGAAGSSTTTP
jgi:hypothetical protein